MHPARNKMMFSRDKLKNAGISMLLTEEVRAVKKGKLYNPTADKS